MAAPLPRVAGIVLAAGSGARMGRPKAEIVLAGERLVDRAVRVLGDGGCAPLVAVVRAGVVVAGATVVINPDPSRGMRSSLDLGLAAVGAADTGEAADAVATLLVDLPGVGADAVRATLAAWRPGRVAIACFDGRRGHPIVMEAALWARATAVAGADTGARVFLRDHPDLVDEVPVAGSADDLDTPDDLAGWEVGG